MAGVKWNVMLSVVDLIEASTAGEAARMFENRLRAAGFEPYEGSEPDVFQDEESENG